MMRWGPFLLILVAAGCGTRVPVDVYENARRQFREGRPREALLEVDGALQKLGPRPEPAWRLRFLLLKSEILLTLGKPSEAMQILDSLQPAGTQMPDVQVRWRLYRARAKAMQRQLEAAGGLFDEALRLATESGAPDLRAEVQLLRTSLFFRKQEWTSAEETARDALESARRSGDAYLETAAAGNLGFRRLSNNRFDEAVPWFEQSIAISEKNGFRRFSAMTRHNLGICQSMLGDVDKALRLLAQAEREYVEIGDTVGQEKCSGDIGNVQLNRGDLAAALASYRKALVLARQLHDSDDIARWQNNLARASLESGDLDSAEASMRDVLALRQKVRDDRAAVWALLNSALIAAGRGRRGEAEGLFTETIASASKLGMAAALLQARAKLGSFYLETGDSARAERQFQAIVAEGESSRSRLQRDEWKLAFQSSFIPFYRQYVDFLMDRGRRVQALEVAESCRARLLAEKLGPQHVLPRRATAMDFRANARAEGAVLLSYWLAPRRSFLWAVTPDGIQSFILPPGKDISQLIEAYTNAVLRAADPLETNNASGSRLFELLVAPAQKLVGPGAKVVIVPDGALHELNFETLLTNGESPHYWIEEATITVAPSLAVLRPTGSAMKGKRLLLLGSPAPPSPEYAPLPASDAEIGRIKALFPADEETVLTGTQAHPGAYREAGPEAFALIHFSAHAVANSESPLDSAVILSSNQDSYKLYARDVAALPLRANLVTISACRSAGARTYSGEGLVGFTWAFLEAGARSVIAGLWDVADRSTSDLMIELYGGLAKGLAPAEALRAAKLALLHSNTAYRKPYYWAPFQLYTRSTPFSGGLRRPGR